MGERLPPRAPHVLLLSGAVACVAHVCVLVRPAWGLPCSLSRRVSRQQRASKFRAADGYVRSCMCCLPPSEVLLTFHTSPQVGLAEQL